MINIMEKIVFLIALATLVCGIQYDGLRVKFGWSDALADMEYFFKIPRTISEAESEGWRRTERPPGPLKELRMYCPPGRYVCSLYDTAGFVAGLQIAIPVDEFESPLKPEGRFVKWHAAASEGEPAKDYWSATQYYVSEESLKAGAGPQIENGNTLQDGGVWVTGMDGRLMRIPSTEAELNTTAYKKQNCIPNMGTHYYYNMTKDLNCDHLMPWFATVTESDLVATGYQTIGRMNKPKKARSWFDDISAPAKSTRMTLPFAPDCLVDMVDKYGVLSIHIYYINEPWTIRCKSGDSAQPAPALDRLMLNGVRYATQISDEVYKLFSG
ncbi:hypothetical protein K1T71_010936 [Dendrolimus kikuchii]|uniref:Uncharacterized protein n=1 Tax=Dendrolimus kikuchii TaxID=765133 RepID=A0ACC1CRA6_9NEOP|nr:hypothetical protein K1T71_010936 [Dendrolimus kikuchii]